MTLKPCTKRDLTSIQDSDNLIKCLSRLGEIQVNKFLFTIDIVAMYPNINTNKGTTVLLVSFHTYLSIKDKKLLMN